jgi:hypothetical protein
LQHVHIERFADLVGLHRERAAYVTA